MKAVLITKENVDMLASRFNVMKEDYEDRLPLGFWLITDFGNDENFDVVRVAIFNTKFVVGETLQNGFVAIERI